jgi:uncharacterized protein YbbC (DUF1343 family)
VQKIGLLILAFGCVCADLTAVQVKLGNEVLAEHHFKELAGKRVGLLTNPSGVNRHLQSTVDLLRFSKSVKLISLFGPEHGIYGEIFAGETVESQVDPRTGLMVHSLYGSTHQPTAEMLKGLDALVYDLQDTGCRSYTYISTMGVTMDACARYGVEFVVLDRPDPLGGERVEGPMLVEKFRSFVGKWDVPYVYGLTCGELARMINGEGWISNRCHLTVVPLKGWKRSMVWRDTGLPWVPTSPHVPHDESPMFQVATGMLGEIGGINTGIGYTLPFQCVAAPGIDSDKLADALNAYHLRGILVKPTSFRPYYFAYKDQQLKGVQLYFPDPSAAQLTAFNVVAMEALKKSAGIDLFERAAQSNKSFSMFDKVNGTDATRKSLQKGVPAMEIIASWKPGEDLFRKRRQKYLLY